MRFLFNGLTLHLRRRWPWYAALAIGVVWFHTHYFIGVSITHSLPNRFFLVKRGTLPNASDQYVAFKWDRRTFYRSESVFIKIVAGRPGQTITRQGSDVFIDGIFVGTAKPRSKHGEPLQAIEPVVIPSGQLYVLGTSPDSLDSRYTVTGLIDQSRIVGVAHALD
jgi:conjugal transfer pilin signal peptidase TrbI